MSAFLEGHIADSVKMKKQLTGFLQKKRRNPNDRTANPEHLREGTGSKYLYKVHPHTGKTEGDILE